MKKRNEGKFELNIYGKNLQKLLEKNIIRRYLKRDWKKDWIEYIWNEIIKIIRKIYNSEGLKKGVTQI